MNAEVDVMADLGGPLTRGASDDKLDRFRETFASHGVTRWVVTDRLGGFLGCCGIVPHADDHPLGEHWDIGRRLSRDAWGHGYPTEAAIAALTDAFERIGLPQVLSYTAADNARSQAVMNRLGMQRRVGLDFASHYDGYELWNGLVWVATSPSVDDS
jgi:RimJ/RimL family protein N-acetyltransferase